MVCRKDEKEIINNIIPNDSRIKIIIGGEERKDSVYNALKITNNEIVLIHDGAIPLLKDKYITDCLKTIDDYYGCAIGVKAKDTIKIIDGEYTNIKITTCDDLAIAKEFIKWQITIY